MIKTVLTSLVLIASVSLIGQTDPGQPGNSKTELEFTLSNLYSQEQLSLLQLEAPQKYTQIVAFFDDFEALDVSVQSVLDKRVMFRFYIKDKAKYDLLVAQAINQTSEE